MHWVKRIEAIVEAIGEPLSMDEFTEGQVLSMTRGLKCTNPVVVPELVLPLLEELVRLRKREERKAPSDVKEELVALFREATLVGADYAPQLAERALDIVSKAAVAKSEAIVQVILDDLTGRAGFDYIWDGTDEEIIEDMLATWRRMVVQELEV